MLIHKGEVLLPSIAYGDAAGLPVETQTAEYIQENYGTIRALLASDRNPYYEGIFEVGMWSDDTQLSIAVAEALIEADGFDIDAMARQHLVAYDATGDVVRNGKLTKRGWGGSTVSAMEKLKTGVSPAESGTLDGSGNGVLMKMAPLAYWHAARNTPAEQRYTDYDALTTMTHDSAIARLATRIHGDVLKHLIENGYARDEFLEEVNNSVHYHESELGTGTEMSELLGYLKDMKSKDDVLINTDAKGFYAPQTLAMAYGAFVLNRAQFTDSVYEAVNLGGDTDSTGSIVAAMSAFANRETVRIPVDHQHLDQLAFLKQTSRKLAQKALLSIETS